MKIFPIVSTPEGKVSLYDENGYTTVEVLRPNDGGWYEVKIPNPDAEECIRNLERDGCTCKVVRMSR